MTAIAHLSLAGWLLVAGRGSRVHQAFAFYLLVAAFQISSTAIGDFSTDPEVAFAGGVAAGVALLLAVPTLLALALYYPAPVGTRAFRAWANGVVSVASAAAACVGALAPAVLSSPEDPYSILFVPLQQLPLAATGLAALWFSRRLVKPGGGVDNSVWLVTLGFAIYPLHRGVRAAYLIVDTTNPGRLIAEGLQLASFLAAAVAAWRLARRHPGGAKGPPWGLLALYAITIASGFVTALGLIERSISFPLTVLALPILVAYGILRHDLFGLDMKVRFAVRQSTVAAVFIAVFFVVSETAQQFFAGVAGSQYLGIIAAGGLLFVLAPLQRAAGHLADRAVPFANSPSPGDDLYRAMVRRFLASGRLTRDQERALADLATELGIDASRAFRLREEADGDSQPN